MSSLAPNTIKRYDCYFKKWYNFCKVHNIDYLSASVPNILYFLTTLYNSNSQYGSLNSCKSALSNILGPAIMNDDRIEKFMKGVFRTRPPQPKYQLTWDTNIVLNYLSTQFPNENLDLKLLSKKLVTIIALVTGHRLQTISKIKIKNISFNTDCIVIRITDLIKTTKPNTCHPILRLPFYIERPEICPATTLCTYKNVTEPLRNSENLFISYRKPHRDVTSQTLSHWIRDILHKSGVDTSVFSSHSTRHASTSKAKLAGVSVDVIRKTAGWSASSSVFARYYNKDIVPNQDVTFARTILDSFD